MSIPSRTPRSPLAAIVPLLWAALTLSGCHAQLKTSPETATLTDLRRAIAHHEKHEEVVEAIELQEELTSRLLKEPGENNRVTIEALAHLAELYSTAGHAEHATGLNLRASRLADKTLGKQDRLSVQLLYNIVSGIAYSNIRLANEKLREIWSRQAGSAAPRIRVKIRRLMGDLYRIGEDCEYAINNYKEGIDIADRSNVKIGYLYEELLEGMARCHRSLGDNAKAVKLEEEALRMREKKYGFEFKAREILKIVDDYVAREDYESAIRALERFPHSVLGRLFMDPVVRAEFLSHAADLRLKQSKKAEAEALISEANQLAKDALQSSRRRVNWYMVDFFESHEQTVLAIKALERMEKQIVDEVGASSTRLHVIYLKLWDLYDVHLDRTNAERYRRRAIEIASKHPLLQRTKLRSPRSKNLESYLVRDSDGDEENSASLETGIMAVSINVKKADSRKKQEVEPYKVKADNFLSQEDICTMQFMHVFNDVKSEKFSYQPDRECLIEFGLPAQQNRILRNLENGLARKIMFEEKLIRERFASHMLRLFSGLGQSGDAINLVPVLQSIGALIPRSAIDYYSRDIMNNSIIDTARRVGQTVSLAESLLRLGDLQRAEQLFRRIYDFGIDRREAKEQLRQPLLKYAKLLASQQRVDEVYPLLARLFEWTEGRTPSAVSLVTQHLSWWDQRAGSEEADLIYAMAAAYPDHPELRRLAVREALLRKGRAIEGMAIYSQAFSTALQAGDQELVERLRQLHSKLAILSFWLAHHHSYSTKRSLLRDLQAVQLEIQAREKQLAGSREVDKWLSQQLAGLSETGECHGQGLAGMTAPVQCHGLSARMLSALTRALPSHTAYVEYLQYWDPVRREAQYLALIVKGTGELAAVPLGPADVINAQVQELLRHTDAGDEGYHRPTQLLYDLTWRKLQYLLDDAQRVYVSPDGQLALLPFHMLHDGRRYLDEQLEIVNLTSGRDLLRRHEDAPATGVTVMFAPAYSLANDAPQVLLSSVAHRGVRLQRGNDFPPLPGTEREAQAIAAQWKNTQKYSGADASEANLFRLTAQGILHIATHGVFDGLIAGTDDGGRSAKRKLEKQPGEKRPQPEVEIPPQGPLLKSALVLAGANTPKHSEILPGQLPPPDGLATALEIASSSHVGTQLVILSACETAKGAVQTGEGVLGLRTAWLATGVESLVASHWRVDDEVTAEFMAHYHRLLAQGMGRSAGLRQAAAEIRRKYPHPHYWAAFSLFGEAGPLRGMGDKAILGPKLDAAPVR